MVGLSEALLPGTIGALMAWNLVYTRTVWRDLDTVTEPEPAVPGRP